MVDPLLLRTRRHFFHDCALVVGAMGLASLLKSLWNEEYIDERDARFFDVYKMNVAGFQRVLLY